MTLGPLVFIGLTLMLALVGFGLLVRPLKAEFSLDLKSGASTEKIAARHFRHLAQLRHAFSNDDRLFIDHRLPLASAKRIRSERREALRKYIVGIGEDFACLDRLAREVAALSPKVEHRHETERLYLEIRFRILYRLALFRLSAAGNIPFEAVAHLSEIVGTLSREVEAMMTSLQPLTPAESARNSAVT